MLVERIKNTFISAGSWQNFRLKIVAKRDLTELPKFEWMCGFYKHHMRLMMPDISKVLLNQKLLISQTNTKLQVDIISKDPRVKGASDPEKLAKDLKDLVNDGRNLICKQTQKFPAKNIYEELLPHWLSPAFSFDLSFRECTLEGITNEIDQNIRNIYEKEKMNMEISQILIKLDRVIISSPL